MTAGLYDVEYACDADDAYGYEPGLTALQVTHFLARYEFLGTDLMPTTSGNLTARRGSERVTVMPHVPPGEWI